MTKLVKIKKALISVSDKSNLKEIISILSKYNVKIISSGGTYKTIKKLGFKSTEISNYTGFNEILEGRVKTLHPKIHAGILSIRKNEKHKKDLKKNNFDEIDLVIVNFYPFEKKIEKNINFNSIIKNIDIGGPTLARAAAKNYNDVVILTNTSMYNSFLEEFKKYKGATSLKFRENSSANAFNETAYYESLISNYLNNKINLLFPHKKTFYGKLVEQLRYGENPHQKGAFYSIPNNSFLHQVHGKKLSFNNYNDILSALTLLKSFGKKYGTAIMKHANPSGVSVEKNYLKSFNLAFNCDSISSFGGIVFCNYIIKKELANILNKIFFEVIISNGFEKDALHILKKKKNVRLIDASKFINRNNYDLIFHKNSFLLQDVDNLIINKKNLKIVSSKKPTKKQFESLLFAFHVCKHVKSNAIVIVKNKSTIGIGSGQPSRLDSCTIAINKARQFFPNFLNDSVAASDAFFPFTDGIEKLVLAGVDAIIQPSGSINDKEIIKFANKTGTVLIFSESRHFKH